MAGASKFTNRDRLRRKMKAIPLEVRKALKTQNAQNAADLVDTMRGFAPVQDGDLVSSIKHRDVSGSTRISQRVSAGAADAPYASWVEFGTTKSEASPFFWVAYRLLRRRMKSRMSRAAKKAIGEAIT
jgi:HK97 gp10 family phage protein